MEERLLEKLRIEYKKFTQKPTKFLSSHHMIGLTQVYDDATEAIELSKVINHNT